MAGSQSEANFISTYQFLLYKCYNYITVCYNFNSYETDPMISVIITEMITQLALINK